MTARKIRILAVGAAIGGGIAYLVGPQGRRRRNEAVDRAGAVARDAAEAATGAAQTVTQQAQDVAAKAQHREEVTKEFDDVTLARKVESEIFRDDDAPKGQVDINVQEGVVQLRGELDSQQLIDDLVGQTRQVQGVRDVENLLHVRGTEAPMHQ